MKCTKNPSPVFRKGRPWLERREVSLWIKERCHLLESEFCVAGGARETGDTPGLVEGRDHCSNHSSRLLRSAHNVLILHKKVRLWTLTITLNHAVAVIAHVTKELHLEKYTLDLTNLTVTIKYFLIAFLPGYNEFRSMPTPFSHNADDRGKASHTWRTQNAKKKRKERNFTCLYGFIANLNRFAILF